MGPKGYSMTLEKFDYKSGGTWRYIQADPKGNKYGFHGFMKYLNLSGL
ncbi:MAG: hypothetical protein M1308_00195 [Actinobacteria bacterium]|nr:hypothetical protein [Actinomycetota bacterium]